MNSLYFFSQNKLVTFNFDYLSFVIQSEKNERAVRINQFTNLKIIIKK